MFFRIIYKVIVQVYKDLKYFFMASISIIQSFLLKKDNKDNISLRIAADMLDFTCWLVLPHLSLCTTKDVFSKGLTEEQVVLKTYSAMV